MRSALPGPGAGAEQNRKQRPLELLGVLENAPGRCRTLGGLPFHSRCLLLRPGPAGRDPCLSSAQRSAQPSPLACRKSPRPWSRIPAHRHPHPPCPHGPGAQGPECVGASVPLLYVCVSTCLSLGRPPCPRTPRKGVSSRTLSFWSSDSVLGVGMNGGRGGQTTNKSTGLK